MTMIVAWIFLTSKSFWTRQRVVVDLYEVGERGDASNDSSKGDKHEEDI